MKKLMIFEGNNVEAFEFNGRVLFNPKDVCRCLDIVNNRDAISGFNENQKIKLKNSDVVNTDIRKLNNAGENFITESGVYKLIFKSRKPEAEKFSDWVTDEVLPQIRENGFYINEKANNLNIEKLEQQVMKLKERNRMLSEENKTIKFYDKQVTGAWITINWDSEFVRIGEANISIEFIKSFTSKYLNKYGLPKLDRESVQRVRIIDRQMKISRMCLESIIQAKGRENVNKFLGGNK